MKQCFLLLTLLSLASYSFSQANDSLERLRDHYLRIRKHEVTAGNIMLGVGIALNFFGFLSAFRNSVDHAVNDTPGRPYTGTTVAGIGVITALGSIPVFVVAHTHKIKAMHMKLDMQKTQALLPASRLSATYQPSLTLSFSLSKRKRRN